MDLQIGDGYLRVIFDIDSIIFEKLRDMQTIIRTFEVGIISLKEEYNKYIEIYYKEVWSMLKMNLQLFSSKKGLGSTKNGRDSKAKLGTKRWWTICSCGKYLS